MSITESRAMEDPGTVSSSSSLAQKGRKGDRVFDDQNRRSNKSRRSPGAGWRLVHSICTKIIVLLMDIDNLEELPIPLASLCMFVAENLGRYANCQEFRVMTSEAARS